MYQPHNPVWLTFTLVGLVAVFGLAVLIRRRKRLRLPKSALVAFWILAVAHVVVLLGIRTYDKGQLRRELAHVVPGEVAKLELRRAGTKTVVQDPSRDIRRADHSPNGCRRGGVAHHSHPVDKVEA